MPRRQAYGSAGIIFHVLNRGAFQHRLFTQPDHYLAFLEVVRRGLERYPIDLFAFCIMPTHWHLALRPATDEALARFMAWITTTHAQRWRRAGETAGQGAVYQGRYKAIPVQNGLYLLVLLWYVERNALRAGLVLRAQDWPWSSASDDGRNGNAIPMAAWPILRPSDWPRMLNSWDSPTSLDDIRLATARGRPFGDERWQLETASRLGLEHTLGERGRRVARGLGFPLPAWESSSSVGELPFNVSVAAGL